MGSPVQAKAWSALERIASAAGAPEKYSTPVIETDWITADFSKSMVPDDALGSLVNLAEEQGLEDFRRSMFAGEKINITENRAVLHTALRRPRGDVVTVDGRDIMPDIHAVLDRMKALSDKIRAEAVIQDIVHIGIGGSDLGPRLVCEALKHLQAGPRIHFVSNVDAADIAETLRHLNPQTTLFIVASKTFTTQETMMNAAYARRWLVAAMGEAAVASRFIALSANRGEGSAFGIDADHMFEFWDWVGGRYSVWSAIGLPICLACGFDVFRAFLDGAYAMDNHFLNAPLAQNMPVILALTGIWHRNFKNAPAYAALPYARNLRFLPEYLQQLDMESNGKSVDRDGRPITAYKTGPIIFGQAGTDGQHAFHQWLHQGTDIIPVTFVTIKDSPYDAAHHDVLNAHASAQALALENGVDRGDQAWRSCAGGKPSVTVTLNDAGPESTGALLVLFEHTVFTQGVIWNINSFDQWGVELGKEIAKRLLST